MELVTEEINNEDPVLSATVVSETMIEVNEEKKENCVSVAQDNLPEEIENSRNLPDLSKVLLEKQNENDNDEQSISGIATEEEKTDDVPTSVDITCTMCAIDFCYFLKKEDSYDELHLLGVGKLCSFCEMKCLVCEKKIKTQAITWVHVNAVTKNT